LPKIQISVNHKLGKAVAVIRVKHLVNNAPTMLSSDIADVKTIWNNGSSEFSFLLRGIKIAGELQVENDTVLISGNLPLLFYPLKSQIEKAIRERAISLLI
jgi:hypothetical protein